MKTIILTLTIGMLSTFCMKAVNYQDFAITFGIIKNYTSNPYTFDWSDDDWAYVASYLLYEADMKGEDDFSKVFSPIMPYLSITRVPLEGQSVDGAEGDAYCLANYGGGKLRFPWYAKLFIPKQGRKLLFNYKQLELVVGDSIPMANRIYSYELPSSNGIKMLLSNPNKRYLNIVHSLSKKNFSKGVTDALLKKATETYWSILTSPIPGRPKLRHPLKNKYAKMGSAVCMWNDIRHFYPHIERHVDEWDAALNEFINFACDTSLSNEEYYFNQRKLLSIIDDGHIALWGNIALDKAGIVAGGMFNDYYVPAEFDYVDGVAYVKNVSEYDSLQLKKYDVVKRINGQPIEDFIDDKKKLVSAATEVSRKYQASKCISMATTREDAVVYEVERKSKGIIVDTLYASRTMSFRTRKKASNERLKNLGNGVIYYDASIKGKVSKKEIERMNEASAVIYDLRNGIDFKFEETLAHMSDELKLPIFPKVVTHRPFGIGSYEYEIAEKIDAKKPLLTSKAYFLSTHKMISWGETVLQIIKGNNLGMIIGETSAGTNGNITRFSYPIYQLTMTGIRAYNVDGSEFFGVGVKPDIEVIPTFDGVVKGIDEVLEYTISILKDGK